MLDPPKVRQEMKALQTHFKEKRDYVLDRLRKLGFRINHVPDSTFYIWLDLSGLPDAICDGLSFFEACLKERVIVGRSTVTFRKHRDIIVETLLISGAVPGIFFDLNPSKRRDLFDSPCHHFVRLSYGPRWANLTMGLDAIERVIKKHSE